jgi:hypothetical protein
MESAKQVLKRAARIPVESLLEVYLATLPRHSFAPEKIKRILVFA